MTRPVGRLDVPLPTLTERLNLLLADPLAGVHGQHATSGEGAEMRHLLYDADDDASTPAFPYPTAQEASK